MNKTFQYNWLTIALIVLSTSTTISQQNAMKYFSNNLGYLNDSFNKNHSSQLLFSPNDKTTVHQTNITIPSFNLCKSYKSERDSGISQEVIAEKFIQTCSSPSKGGRIIQGICGLAVGTTVVLYGNDLIDPRYKSDALIRSLYGLGGTLLDIMSIWQMFTCADPVDELEKLKKIEDFSEREIEGHKSLKSIANDKLLSRLQLGLGFITLGSGFILSSAPEKETYSPKSPKPLIILGVIAVVGGVIEIIISSNDEIILKDYEQTRIMKNKINISLGFQTLRGLTLSCMYTY